MFAPRWILLVCGIAALNFAGTLAGQTDQGAADAPPIPNRKPSSRSPTVLSSEPDRERYFTDALRRKSGMAPVRRLSATTNAVGKMLGFVPGGSRTYNFDQAHAAGSIDSYIFADFQANGINPAPKTTDWEFVRRITLDLTGRIPTPDRVLSFVADTAPDKRAKLIEELLAKPEWIDKWTMYFGDLYQNTDNKPSTSLRRFPTGRNAFYGWIKDSLTKGKPYNQMATELIGAAATNTYEDGPSNFLVGGVVTMGPTQDIMDQMTANTFDTFLGMTHVNCLLCHNGRGHLDRVNLWAMQTTRYQAWQLRILLVATPARREPQWTRATTISITGLCSIIRRASRRLRAEHHHRQSSGAGAAGRLQGRAAVYTVPPQYIFNGTSPKPGEDYRTALARSITGDFQFARATVNYLWAYFFGRGMVDPPDTFDPARLDPDNPPPDPWTLQPTNARLLNALAQHFIDSDYDVKA